MCTTHCRRCNGFMKKHKNVHDVFTFRLLFSRKRSNLSISRGTFCRTHAHTHALPSHHSLQQSSSHTICPEIQTHTRARTFARQTMPPQHAGADGSIFCSGIRIYAQMHTHTLYSIIHTDTFVEHACKLRALAIFVRTVPACESLTFAMREPLAIACALTFV